MTEDPSLLARLESAPKWIWIPLSSALALLAPSALALGTHRVFLFASLGPTAVTIAQQPTQPAARPYNAVAGHLIGMTCGFAFVFAFGLAHTPSVFLLHDISAARVAASLLAVMVAMMLELRLNARHPPAAATTLLVSLGSFHPTWRDTALIVGGMITVVVVAELLRRVRLKVSA